VSISFGGQPLLESANLQIQRGERVCLLGRNGAGKTTLMRMLNRDIEPDRGTVFFQQGITAALLPQEVPTHIGGLVFDVILGGLGQRGELPVKYHHLSHRLAEQPSELLLQQLDKIQKALEAGGGWDIHREAEMIVTRMHLDPDMEFDSLSAGMKRRVLLARALVSKPDLLLLDEPTNHLDIEAIDWLEDFLLRIDSTILFVTHDRMLVRKLATRVIELDRGRLTAWHCNYDTYLERKDEALAVERQQWEIFDKKLAKEEEWLRRGVKARRTRDEGRVEALMKLRKERSARREQIGTVNMQLQEARQSGKLVIEAEKVTFYYPGEKNKPVVKNLETIIMRGDRVGIIGPNGCGKTTLLRLLVGLLEPAEGSIRLGVNLKITYFDQLRSQLDNEKSVIDNVADGNNLVAIDGKTRHVVGYLQDFLFDPERLRAQVKVLSGGERNRLLLAKFFAKPSNVLVMDEPTNDLDIETLELLEELLLSYPGTILLVSHDRAFLNNVVTSTLVFEGDKGGKVSEYIGGYDDWLLQKPKPAPSTTGSKTGKDTGKGIEKTEKPRTGIKKPTNKEKQEYETLPLQIEALEKEQHELYGELSDPCFYQHNTTGERMILIQNRLESIKTELVGAYHRWQELEERFSQGKPNIQTE